MGIHQGLAASEQASTPLLARALPVRALFVAVLEVGVSPAPVLLPVAPRSSCIYAGEHCLQAPAQTAACGLCSAEKPA